MTTPSYNFYAVLRVQTTASTEEIRKAYRQQAMLHHPDRNPLNIEAATEEMKIITHAMETLSDPIKRDEYDKYLESQMAPSANPDPAGFREAFSHPQPQSNAGGTAMQMKVYRLQAQGKQVIDRFLAVAQMPEYRFRNPRHLHRVVEECRVYKLRSERLEPVAKWLDKIVAVPNKDHPFYGIWKMQFDSYKSLYFGLKNNVQNMLMYTEQAENWSVLSGMPNPSTSSSGQAGSSTSSEQTFTSGCESMGNMNSSDATSGQTDASEQTSSAGSQQHVFENYTTRLSPHPGS